MEICDFKITLKEFLELPIGIKGKIAIWPPAKPKENILQLCERVEHFDNICEKGIDKYLDKTVMQVFASTAKEAHCGELNIVLME